MEKAVDREIAWIRAETTEGAVLMLKAEDASAALKDLYNTLRAEWKHGDDPQKSSEAERMWGRVLSAFEDHECTEFLV